MKPLKGMKPMYMIQRSKPMKNGHRAFLNQSGSHNSYTSSRTRSRKFDTIEEAKAECCGNEFPVSV